jgi:hypothetical protein
MTTPTDVLVMFWAYVRTGERSALAVYFDALADHPETPANLPRTVASMEAHRRDWLSATEGCQKVTRGVYRFTYGTQTYEIRQDQRRRWHIHEFNGGIVGAYLGRDGTLYVAKIRARKAYNGKWQLTAQQMSAFFENVT